MLKGSREKVMSLQSWLISSDQMVLVLLPDAVKQAGVSVDVYRCAGNVAPLLDKHCVATLIIDCDERDEAWSILKRVRQHPANRRAITVVIASEAAQIAEAFELGATLVLRKPLSRERTVSAIRALRNMIIHEKRRSARQPVQVPLALNHGRVAIRATTLNVSTGGIGFTSDTLPEIDQQLEASFALPGTDVRIRAVGLVTWVDRDSKRGGVKFLQVERLELLRNWMNDRFEEERVTALINPEVCFKD